MRLPADRLQATAAGALARRPLLLPDTLPLPDAVTQMRERDDEFAVERDLAQAADAASLRTGEGTDPAVSRGGGRGSRSGTGTGSPRAVPLTDGVGYCGRSRGVAADPPDTHRSWACWQK
jgi:hypothetical protein